MILINIIYLRAIAVILLGNHSIEIIHWDWIIVSYSKKDFIINIVIVIIDLVLSLIQMFVL